MPLHHLKLDRSRAIWRMCSIAYFVYDEISCYCFDTSCIYGFCSRDSLEIRILKTFCCIAYRVAVQMHMLMSRMLILICEEQTPYFSVTGHLAAAVPSMTLTVQSRVACPNSSTSFLLIHLELDHNLLILHFLQIR